MVTQHTKREVKPSKQFVVRKLAKSGASRYLAIGTIFPQDWLNVKVVVEAMTNEGCILRITPIR